MSYEIELAREIITQKETKTTEYIPIISGDNEFLKYKDTYIKVIAGNKTKALLVEIYHPLTTASSNPIIYVDDEGKCYRNHGERAYFIMYAERLLGKALTIGAIEQNKTKQEEIDALFK